MILKAQLSKEYIAGFLDGEGCIRIHIIRKKNSKDQYALNVGFTQNNIGVLELIQNTYGGRIYKDKNAHKLELVCSKADILLRDIFPYLIVKKEEARIALEYRDELKGKRNVISLRHKYYLTLQDLKKGIAA